jgi:hypothetical protein
MFLGGSQLALLQPAFIWKLDRVLKTYEANFDAPGGPREADTLSQQ